MNRITDVIDRPEPTLAVVTFAESVTLDDAWQISAFADVIELRADRVEPQNSTFLALQARKLAHMPVLLTLRSAEERGGWSGSEQERLDLYAKLMPNVDGVDVEINAPILPDVIAAAHEAGKIVIASRHDFNSTPTDKMFEAQLARSQEAEADYAKFAVSTQTYQDFKRLAEFTLRHKGEGIITMGMDKYGSRSRITLPWLGSRLTYAFGGDTAVVKGQMGYLETYQRLVQRYPDYTNVRRK